MLPSAAVDPAVRMALTPNGVIQNNCFEKTLSLSFKIFISIAYMKMHVNCFIL